MKRIYLDYAASTPVSEAVSRAMRPYFSDVFGNSESAHSFGREAQKAVDGAREVLAGALGVGFREIVFTGSATEANNMALRGVVHGHGKGKNIVISSIEHSSVYKTAEVLGREGIEVRLARPGRDGIVAPETVKKLLDGNTLLVSVMQGNNEIGTIQPIAEIGKMIKEKRLKIKDSDFPLFHTDAAQSFAYLPLRPRESYVDLATTSGHKMYGPKGVAALFVRGGVKLAPQTTGGEHERGLRAGTLNIPAIVGFAEAVKNAEERRKTRVERTNEFRRYFWESLKKIDKSAEVNGSLENFLPHILNIYFPNVFAEELVIALDMQGVAVSAGSACTAGAQTVSRTVRETYQDEERARRSVRVSFGDFTTKSELANVLKILKSLI